ncbi:antifreeze protein [Thioclava sp. FR2]|uniref:antifreeze protein n=1 Tax=Thioclava sp. FR2 TaxID=3445780 RepID=UPI003EBEB6E8
MSPFFSPAEAIHLSIRTAMMLHEAQMVVGLRLMAMAGMWTVTPSENHRMVKEKLEAACESGMAASHAAMSGKRPAQVAEAALTPIARRTRSNVTRLSRAATKPPRK